MLKEFHIQNFKVFESLDLKDLSVINLIGGLNNTGKTSLLEGIYNFYKRREPDVLINSLIQRAGVEALDKSTFVWTPAFYNYNIHNPISLTGKTHDSSLCVNFAAETNTDKNNTGQTINLSGTTSSGDKEFSFNASSLNVSVQSNKTITYKSFIFQEGGNINSKIKKTDKSYIPPVQLSPGSNPSSQNDAISYGDVVKSNKEEVVLNALQTIEPRLKSIHAVPVTSNQTILYGDIGLKSKVPLQYMGDGISRLLSYITAIMKSENGTLLIDEIENGLHYSIHQKVWQILYKLAKQLNVQVFANTHSFEMAKAFNNAALELDPGSFAFVELFIAPQNQKVSSNTIDTETLSFKINHQKPFRGE